jgi:hypothetical protein
MGWELLINTIRSDQPLSHLLISDAVEVVYFFAHVFSPSLRPLPIQLASYRIMSLLPAVLSRKHFLPETL